jgi:hypothetical protein
VLCWCGIGRPEPGSDTLPSSTNLRNAPAPYSGFLQLQRDIQLHPVLPFSQTWIKKLVMRQLADNLAQLAAADFDKWFELVEEHQIYEVGRNSSFPPASRPLLDWH